MPTYSVNGTTLSVTERGSGFPVVLVHGFPLSHRMWDAQAAALADRYRVITPDLRGFGASASTEPFTLESQADDLHALLAQIKATPCVLGGLSMGGYITLAYAKKYPADLRALMLIDTKAEGDTPEGKQARDKMIELARKDGSRAVADQMLPKLLAKDAATTRPQVAQALRQIMESQPPQTIEHALAALRDRPDRAADLSSINIPTLVLVGDQDAITPPEVAERMARGINAAELVVVQGAGHMAPMEQPEQVNRAIRMFLERVTS